jgi:hypothetical protein
LVLLDNATAEYSFIAAFFFVEPLGSPPSTEELEIGQHSVTPEPHDRKEVDDSDSAADSEARTPVPSPGIVDPQGLGRLATMDKTDRTELGNIWKKIFDPSLEYTKAGHGRQSQKSEFDGHLSFIQTFLGSVIEPLPPATPLLTMVRLTEAVIAEVQKRQCSPLETFFFTMRLQLWPVFQKVISEHCDSLKKLSERPSGYFSKASVTTDASVTNASIQSAHLMPTHPTTCRSANATSTCSSRWSC